MDLSLLSAIDWRQPVPQQYDIRVGMIDRSAFQEDCATQLQTTFKVYPNPWKMGRMMSTFQGRIQDF